MITCDVVSIKIFFNIFLLDKETTRLANKYLLYFR